MTGNVFSRDTIRLILATVMAFCLFLALACGTAALVWYGQPYGTTFRGMAGVFAWLFTAAFLTTFALAVFEERQRGRERSGRKVAGTRD
jgi:hypothetical protein